MLLLFILANLVFNVFTLPARNTSRIKKKCLNLNNTTFINLFNNWNNALLSLEPEKVVNLYSKKSVLLATLENEPLDTRKKKLHYFEEFLLKNPVGTLVTMYFNTHTSTSTVFDISRQGTPYMDGTYNFEVNIYGQF